MSKLTLSVDERVVERAKKYARARGVSISQMVETYLSAVAEPVEARRDTPVLQSLRGTLRKADVEDHRKHLAAKYK